MEIFVAGEPQQVQVAVADFAASAHRQLIAAAQQARARSVLEAAVAVAHRGDLEQIPIERRAALRRPAEEVDLPLANASKVLRQPLEVRMVPASDRDFVPHGAGSERRERKIAHLDRMIDEFVVIGGRVAAKAMRHRAVGGQRRRDAPVDEVVAAGTQQLDRARRAVAAFRQQKQAGPVEVRARAIEVRSAHRQLVRVHVRDERDRCGHGFSAPDVFRFLPDRDVGAGRFGAHLHELARELADQVAAGYPRRQAIALAPGIGIVDRAAHFEQMCVWIECCNLIARRLHDGHRLNGGETGVFIER